MSGDMYTVPDPREFPRIVLSDEPDWEPGCTACWSDWCDCEKFLAEGLVTLNGAPIPEDEIPNVLHGAPTVRRYAETVPTVQIGGASVAQGLGRYLAEMSEEDRRWGFREPSHVRWDEVLEFSRHHPQAWHEVRERFDRKPRWKK